ncbi:MAG: flagellar basal body-associated FliL family protein [Janthinobacterium lividum]
MASVYVELFKMIAGFDSQARRAAYVRLKTKLELARKEDAAIARNGMPRVMDLVQGYLRETRLKELRGTAGTYRLRKELVGRTSAAVAPARVVDMLIVELLVQ